MNASAHTDHHSTSRRQLLDIQHVFPFYLLSSLGGFFSVDEFDLFRTAVIGAHRQKLVVIDFKTGVEAKSREKNFVEAKENG